MFKGNFAFKRYYVALLQFCARLIREITEAIDWAINKEFLKLLSLSGTPLFCSIKPSAITDEIKVDLRKSPSIGFNHLE